MANNYTITKHGDTCLIEITRNPDIKVIKISNRTYLVIYNLIKETQWEK